MSVIKCSTSPDLHQVVCTMQLLSVLFLIYLFFSVCYQWGSSLHYFRNILQHCIVNQRFMAIVQVNLR